MLKFIATTILCILIHPLWAQEISNVQVEQNEEELMVTFDIAGPQEEYFVKIELAEDREHFHLIGEMRGFSGKNKYQIKGPVYCSAGIFRVIVSKYAIGLDLYINGKKSKEVFGGCSLDMAGWRWDKKPHLNEESNEEGRIVFEIIVDEEGNVVSVKVLERSVSPALVRKYQKEIENLSFSRVSVRNTVSGARGRITFIIAKSNAFPQK
jgi:hypothetical protein